MTRQERGLLANLLVVWHRHSALLTLYCQPVRKGIHVIIRADDVSGHLSSPAPPLRKSNTPPLPSPHRSSPYSTTQHPHPVPLPSTPVTDFGATEYYSSDDFIPLTQSGHTVELDDGLELLVTQEELPTGTPGGTEADLKHGALIDGAKHEKNGESPMMSNFVKSDEFSSRTFLLPRHVSAATNVFDPDTIP